MTVLDTKYEATNRWLQSHASDALREASNVRRRISADAKPSMTAPRVDLKLTKPNLQEPPKFSDLFPDGDDTDDEVRRLNEMVSEWQAQYFPSINENFRTIPEGWLFNIITNENPFGLHESVFEAIWHSARDREEKQFRSADATLRAEFSTRGFSLPSGAYVTAMDKARQQASEAVQEINRQETIRNEEVKLQLLQLAVQEATQYKLGIMSALADFYRAWMTIPDKELERARVRIQAQSTLLSALSTYYNVEVAFEELRLRAASADVEAQISADRNKIALYDAGGAANALGQAVRGFTDVSAQAAAAASSLIAQIEGV